MAASSAGGLSVSYRIVVVVVGVVHGRANIAVDGF